MAGVHVLGLAFALMLGPAAVAAAPGVMAPPAQMERLKDDSGVTFSGQLTTQSYQQLQQMLKPGEALYIESGAGDPEAALLFARLVQDRDIHVFANECENLCATHVFLPARRRTLIGYANVVFLPTFETIEAALRRHPEITTPAELAKLHDYNRRYRAVLVRSGVDPSILSCIDNRLQPDLSVVRRGEAISNSLLDREVLAQAKYNFLSYTVKAYAQFGAQVEFDARDYPPSVLKGGPGVGNDEQAYWVSDRSQCGSR